MIKGVLFDMDGVLVDNAHMHVKSFDVLYERMNIPVSQRKNVMDYMGNGLAEVLACLLPESVIRQYGVEWLCKEKERIYREIYAPLIHPMGGLVDLLERLKAMGLKCAVGSSGCLENIEFVLEKCGISSYFETVVSADMVTKCKPDPEIYQVAARQLGLLPSECIVFEDAMVGIESAERAGVDHVIALTTSFSKESLCRYSPAYIVKDFTQVTDEMLSGR